jgi:hypothetical protein
MVPDTLIKKFVGLAQKIDSEEPIDWGYLPLDENETYEKVAKHILETYSSVEDDLRDTHLISLCINLMVETIVLRCHLELADGV